MVAERPDSFPAVTPSSASSAIAPPALYVPPPHAQTALLPSEVPLAGSEALAALARVQKASPTPMTPDVHQHATMSSGWKDVVTMLDEAAKGGDPFGFGSFGGGGEGEGQQERTIAGAPKRSESDAKMS